MLKQVICKIHFYIESWANFGGKLTAKSSYVALVSPLQRNCLFANEIKQQSQYPSGYLFHQSET